ncbi:MAG: hypothetical protein QOJ64_3529, partial [Acidobacteriota bacterium]|nr:hypothetical protein [Acidobacteriota bacterium]
MLRVFVAVHLLFIGLLTQAVAQGVCVPATLKIATVCGKVISTYSKGEGSLDGAKITVHKGHSGGPIVARVISGANGRFAFEKLRRGKYVLVV